MTIKGAKGTLSLPLAKGVSVAEKDKTLQVSYTDGEDARISAGSTRAHLANMVSGVTKGYEKKLELVGVGFRAAVQGKTLNLTLGFSHPVNFAIPEGITIEAPTPDRGADQGHRPAARRPGRRGDPRHPSARALQGQGREVFRREDQP